MNQHNQRSKKVIGLLAAIGSGMLFSLPAIAQQSAPNAPYNGNGEVQPNNDRQSPDRNNPGINHSPENRLTPSNTNRMNNQDGNQSPAHNMSPSNSNSGYQQQDPNNSGGASYRSNSYNKNSINSATGSAVLNPCPSIFYEAKYRDSVGIPAGCPASNSGTPSTP